MTNGHTSCQRRLCCQAVCHAACSRPSASPSRTCKAAQLRERPPPVARHRWPGAKGQRVEIQTGRADVRVSRSGEIGRNELTMEPKMNVGEVKRQGTSVVIVQPVTRYRNGVRSQRGLGGGAETCLPMHRASYCIPLHWLGKGAMSKTKPLSSKSAAHYL